MKKILSMAALAGLVSVSASTFALGSEYNTSAYQVQPQGFGEVQNSIGVAGVYHESIYSGVDNDVTPFPMLNFTYDKFFIQNITLGYNAFVNSRIQASLIVAPDLQGYDSDDSSDLSGMNDTDPSINAGGRIMIKTLPIITTLTAVHDVSGNTAGNTFSAKFATGIPLMQKRLILSPSVAFTYQDSNVIDYYYGVTDAEATSSRSAYSPDGTMNTTFGLVAMYRLSPSWQANLTYLLTKYGDEISDSPIVSKSTSSTVLLGISYLFGADHKAAPADKYDSQSASEL